MDSAIQRLEKPGPENTETAAYFIYSFLFFCRNIDPPIWYDTDVKLFEIQRV